MAHLSHYGKKAVKNILKEYLRELKEYANYVDATRTKNNYAIAPPGAVGGTTAEQLATGVIARTLDVLDGKEPQKQTQMLCNWVVTFPREECTPREWTMPDGQTKTYYVPRDEDLARQFFAEVVAFTAARYGAENMLPAHVHTDETSWHAHVPFVPVCTSRKTGRLTVSSASCCTRSELKRYQQDLQKHMTKTFGERARTWILNGKTVLKEGDVKALKLLTEALQAADISAERAQRLSDVENAIEAAKDTLEQLNAEIDAKNSDYEDVVALMAEYRAAIDVLEDTAAEQTKAYERDRARFDAVQIHGRKDLQEAEALRRFVDEMEKDGDCFVATVKRTGKKITAKQRLAEIRQQVAAEDERHAAEEAERQRRADEASARSSAIQQQLAARVAGIADATKGDDRQYSM